MHFEFSKKNAEYRAQDQEKYFLRKLLCIVESL